MPTTCAAGSLWSVFSGPRVRCTSASAGCFAMCGAPRRTVWDNGSTEPCRERGKPRMNALERIRRHARLTWQNRRDVATPPFLILFINSICNQKCEHCFYWRNLNRRDDLSREELFALSRSLGRIETLNLSGGEPFLRPEFAEICRQFIQHNRVRQIYVPTNGYFTERTVKQITGTLEEKDLDLFVAEISLDGMEEF